MTTCDYVNNVFNICYTLNLRNVKQCRVIVRVFACEHADGTETLGSMSGTREMYKKLEWHYVSFNRCKYLNPF